MTTFDEWNAELYHHGIPKMQWYVRRFQNYDGSLTPAGRKRYLKNPNGTDYELNKRGQKKYNKRWANSRKKVKREYSEKLNAWLDMSKKKAGIDSTLFPSMRKDENPGNPVASAGFKTSIKKHARSMSEEELSSAIRRLKLEKEYSDLMSSQNRTTMAIGREVAGEIIKNSIKNIGTQATTYALGAFINKMAKKDLVNPKKGQKDK